jgi:hypothetical protein
MLNAFIMHQLKALAYIYTNMDDLRL